MLIDSIPHRIGKTTVAVNLAIVLGQQDSKVALLDADLTGPNVLQMLGINEQSRTEGARLMPHERHGLKTVSLASLMPPEAAVIWRGPLRSKTLEQLVTETDWGDADTLVMDLPPGTGDEALTIAQQVEPQLAIVVTTPQEVALLDARRAITFARKLEIPKIAIVENMSGLICPHCGETIDLFGAHGGENEASVQGIPLLGKIPLDPAARIAGDEGTPLVLEHPDSAAAVAFRQIAQAVRELVT